MAQMKWFVGVDWGSRTHQACILDGAGAVRGEQAFKHGGAGLAMIGVMIETPRGPVAESLLVHGFAVHSIDPKQLDRFRDRRRAAGLPSKKPVSDDRKYPARRPPFQVPGTDPPSRKKRLAKR